MARKEKRNVRFDNRHVRLKTGETQKKNGYEYRWTTKDGKRHSIFATTLDGLREMEADLAADQHDGIKTDIKGLTVNDCYNLWKELKRGIKDSTFKNYIYMYEMFVMPTFGKKRVVQVVKSDVKRFYNNLCDDQHLKISTIDGIHNVLHQVFQVAVDDNYIRANPCTKMLKELKVAHGHEVEKRKALSVGQQELFLKFISETDTYKHWYPVFYIMLNTGMRVGEITGLRWRDVDFESGFISVNHTLVYYNHRDEVGTYYSINTPKTDAGKREIPMIEGVKEAFEMERRYQEENGIESKARIDGYDDFIFVNRKVDSWTGYRYYDEDQALQYVKIKNLQMAGFSIDEIKGLLDADNDTMFKAFSAKIKEQEDRLQKTREIQQSYLSEVQRMKEKVKEFREAVLSLMEDYDPTDEFGISTDEYREIVDSLTTYLDTHEFTKGDFDYDLSDDGDAAREEPEYLNVLNNPDFEVIYEQHGWEHAREVIGKFTVPDDGKEYMLLFTISKDKENQTAFANTALSVMLGANLKSRERTCQNSQKLGCNVTVSEDGQNHFWLLKRK